MSTQEHKTHSEWTFRYAPRGRNSVVSRKNSEMYADQLHDLGIFLI